MSYPAGRRAVIVMLTSFSIFGIGFSFVAITFNISLFPASFKSYDGTMYNKNYNKTASFQLQVAHNESGRLSGEVTIDYPLCGTGRLNGTLTDGRMEATVVSAPMTDCESQKIKIEGSSSAQGLAGKYTVYSYNDSVETGTWQAEQL